MAKRATDPPVTFQAQPHDEVVTGDYAAARHTGWEVREG